MSYQLSVISYQLSVLAIFVNCFFLERTNQLSLLPDKDLVDLCPPIEPYQVTKNLSYQLSVISYQLSVGELSVGELSVI
ncbi:hypothetical protein [Microcystis sp. M_OC_Ca_00000000_S217Cul]|uniref:hypothetical protein n=1 Tax=Microcystis sp. M_OC_Ca_00000000_S217Cul TaxID=2486214 RepID=UPI00257ECEC4|nr:hypothetical protein [Microcystis sp. M_OC_Ca_00000000_S217Cul]